MANNYEQIMALVNAGNKMGLSNAITRDNGIPLDLSSVYNTYEDAVVYAATKAIAYQNQVIAAEGIVYVIVAESQGKVTVGDVEYDNYLKPVGTAPSGDNASISVTAEGLVSLFGFSTAEDGKLPMKVDGAIVWKSLQDIGAGDGNDNTTYEFALTDAKTGIIVTPLFNGQPIMEGEEGAQTQKKFELVLDVYTKGEADEKFLAKADYTPYDDTELAGRVKAIEDDYLKEADKYDDSDLQNRVAAIEGDYLKEADKYDDTDVKGRLDAIEADYLKAADKYDDTALAGRVTTAEGKITALETESAKHATKDELAEAIKDFATDTELADGLALKADKTALEDLKSTVDAFLTGDGTEAALDSLKELIAYIDSHDDVDIAGIIEDIEAIEGKLAGIDSTVVAYVTAAIDALKIGDYAKASELTALAGRVEALEAKPFDTYAIKSDVEAEFAKYTTTETLTSQLAAKADADKVVAKDAFETFKSENTTAIGTAKSEAIAAAKTETETQVGALEDAVAETYATKTELSEAVEGIETALNDYAKTADVETELNKKANSADVYTKTEVDNKIGTPGVPAVTDEEGNEVTPAVQGTGVFANAYSRAEIDKLLDEVQGGSSASADSVLRQLNTYKSTNDDRVKAVEDKNAAQDTAIQTAQAQADKGVADAKAASEAVVALETGKVATNISDISAIKGRLNTLETAKGDHETRIATAEGKIASLETATANNASAIGVLQGKDVELVAEDERLAGLIAALQSDKADKSDTYTKKEVDDAVADAIAGADLGTYAKVSDLEAIYKAGEGEEAATGVLADEIARAKAAEKANSDAIAALIGEDTNKTIRAIAAEETAAIVAGADAKYDTLKEIADFIMNDETGAAAMANDIAALKTKVDTGDKSVSTYVSDALAAIVQPKASAEVSVAEDGTLGIIEMNVNKLVQTTGDTLIIDGGNAK